MPTSLRNWLTSSMIWAVVVSRSTNSNSLPWKLSTTLTKAARLKA